MTDPHVPFPPLRCRVFDAADIRAILGANAGDPVAGAEAVSLGDTYALRADAKARDVAMCPAGPDRSGAQYLAEGTEVGQPGDRIAITARLTLMAPDGQSVDLLIVRHQPNGAGARAYALPLAPMAPATEYALIAADANPGEVQLADVVCASFVAGTRITLADGSQRAIERLVPGDRVLTRDHGAQPLRWNGSATLRAIGGFAPVVIPAGAMGNHAALILSQSHRLFVYHRPLAQIIGMPEVLIRAGQLLGNDDIHLREGGFVDYHALIFDRHEIIYAEGIPAESLLVAAATLDRLPVDLARELRARFPALNQPQHFGYEADETLIRRLGRNGLRRA